MSAAEASEGSEDVQEFLKRIRELSEKREKEDTERTRKLEEDILEGRRQREARRLERARSISPEKRSPALSIRSPYASPRLSARTGDRSASPLPSPRMEPVVQDLAPVARDLSPSKQVDRETLSKLELPQPKKSVELEKPALPPKPTNLPARSGTLSWQQRPGSLRGVRSRPISLANDRTQSPLAKSSATSEDESMTKEDIARKLSSRDPNFFRQTAERGTSSAAYRKNQVEDADVVDTSANKLRLHGLAETPQRALKDVQISRPSLDATANTSTLPSRIGTPFGQSSSTRASWALPLPTQSSQRFSPTASPESSYPSSSTTIGRKPRETGDRPGSPSKGIGSFVQSAMMKRSDSVSKRWSAQASPDMSRANSVAGYRSSRGSPIGSPEPSRMQQNAPVGSPELTKAADDEEGGMASPTSPSKRFSPVKSSWLESALTRPESPKPSAAPQQPSWMADLSRNKIQRNSVDVSSLTKGHVGSLQQSPFDKPPSANTNDGAIPLLPEKKPKPTTFAGSTDNAALPSQGRQRELSSSKVEGYKEPTIIASTIRGKPKPVTPPKKDFRSNLKPREAVEDQGKQPELEFRHAAVKLKRTVTGKYVAPDELKDNILRGKAGLQLTDGPQKSPHKDELKESLLAQKEAMQVKAAEGPPSRPASPEKRSTTPEAIARRRLLNSKASAPNLSSSPVKESPKKIDVDETPAPALPARPSFTAQPVKAENIASSKLAERFNPALANILARGPSPFTPPTTSSTPLGRVQTAPTPIRSGTPEGNAKPLEHMTKARAKGPKRRAPKAETPAASIADLSRPPLPRKSSANDRTASGPGPRIVSSSRKVAPASTSPSESTVNIAKSQTWPNEEQKTTLGSSSSIIAALPSKPSKPTGLRSVSGTIPEQEKAVQATAGSADSLTPMSVKVAASGWGRPMTMDQKNAAAPLRSPVKFGSTRIGKTTSSSSLLVPSNENSPVSLTNGHSSHTPKPVTKPASLADRNPVKTPLNSITHSTPSTASSQSSPIPRTSEAGRLFADFFIDPSSAKKSLDIDTQAILEANPADATKLKTLRKSIVELHHDGTTSALPLQQDHVLFSESMYICTHIFGSSTGTRHNEVYLWTGSSVSAAHKSSAFNHAKKTAKDTSGTFFHLTQGKEPAAFLQALGGILVTRTGLPSTSTSYLLRGRRHFGHLAFDEVPLSPTSLCAGFAHILITSSTSRIFLWKGAGANAEELAGARLMAMDIGPTADIIEIDPGSETAAFFSCFPSAASAAQIPKYSTHWTLKSKHDAYRIRLFRIESSSLQGQQASSGGGDGGGSSSQMSAVGAFWRAAAGKTIGTSASSSESGEAGTTVREIVPFVQADLEAEGVYVLDGFFEIYVILGTLARHAFSAFTAAMLFAQDYTILAASTEDRPFVPVGHVVVEGAPVDMKALFRTWSEEGAGTEELMAGRIRGAVREERVVPLAAGIAAVRAV